MIKKNIKCYTLFILLLSWGCSNKTKYKIEYYTNGKIKQIYSLEDNKMNRKKISYYENGNIDFISNYVGNLREGEQLHFYEGNGLLASKIFFKNNIPNGVAYWFYESGSLRA